MVFCREMGLVRLGNERWRRQHDKELTFYQRLFPVDPFFISGNIYVRPGGCFFMTMSSIHLR